MFDFPKWCSWTNAEAERLRSLGLTATFKAANTPVEKAVLEVSSDAVAAAFQFWGDHADCGHGLFDIDVMDLRTQDVTSVCTSAELDDANFKRAFGQFLDAMEAL